MRWRKDKIRISSLTPDADVAQDWQPLDTLPGDPRDTTYSPETSKGKLRASTTNTRPKLRCFADSFRGSDGHTDARNLEKLRVWLGDMEEEKAAVNGLTQYQVEALYFEQTMGGKDDWNAEPVVYDDHVDTGLVVECAACKAQGRPDCETLNIQMIDFECEDNDDAGDGAWNVTGVRKFVSLTCFPTLRRAHR